MDTRTTGERVADLIKKNNITYSDLTEYCNKNGAKCSNATISNICNDIDKGYSCKLFRCIADFFDVSVDYLLCRTENTTKDEDLIFVCNYTGLNENAVKNLNEWTNKDFLNLPIEFTSYLILNGAVRLSELAFKYKANLIHSVVAKENLLKLSDSISQEEFETLAKDACHNDLLCDVNLFRLQKCFNNLIEQLVKGEKDRNIELEKELLKNQVYLREKLTEEFL